MLTGALTSFLTGVTEPLEFSFLFVAYPLYFIHAVLTGTSLALVNALGIRDGFGFSAGATDYLLNFRIAEAPGWLIVIGLGYAVIYYFLFRWVITKWNMRTPGREEESEEIEASLGEEAAEMVASRDTGADAGSEGSGTQQAPGETGSGPSGEAARPAGRDRDGDLPPIIEQDSDDDDKR